MADSTPVPASDSPVVAAPNPDAPAQPALTDAEREKLYTHSLRVTLLGVCVNTVLAIVKTVAGVLGNSYALIADGVESTLDIFSSIMVYSGLQVAARPADEDHPYGHGKAESLAAAVVALVLLGTAVGIAIESVREILTPHHAPKWWTLLVLVCVVGIKEFLFRFAFTVSRLTGSSAVHADAWHHRSDAITSSAAFIGISLALIFGKHTDEVDAWASADDYAALFACVVIAYNGQRLLRDAAHEIMDASPGPEVVAQIRRIASAVPGVQGLDKCYVRKYGMAHLVDLHVQVDGNLPVHEGHRIAHAVKDALKASSLRVSDVLVHIEPVQGAAGKLQGGGA